LLSSNISVETHHHPSGRFPAIIDGYATNILNRTRLSDWPLGANLGDEVFPQFSQKSGFWLQNSTHHPYHHPYDPPTTQTSKTMENICKMMGPAGI